jgi:hypothetical protein
MERTTRRYGLAVALVCACAEGQVMGDMSPDAAVDVAPSPDRAVDVAAPDLTITPPDAAPVMDVGLDATRPDAAPDVVDARVEAGVDAVVMDAAPDVAADAVPDVRDVPAEPMGTVIDATWSTSAMALACTAGQRYTYRCPPRGTLAPCWGTNLYTHDSSVCSAAVHMGRITVDDGGAVTFEMRAGAAGYIGSLRNGVTSLSTGNWPCSIAFP